ncbi:MAG TPA: ECF-type sigma factor [Burkholderiaceae bacterium]|nr:ECF-type sigma factor [Burkholderiaceae bacterium]
MDHLTPLIQHAATGDSDARERLFAAAYPELRKLAHARLRGAGHNTYLATTALVHESYLKLLASPAWRAEDRSAFFAYASNVMRSVIVDAIRARQAERRGGDLQRVTLDTGAAGELPAGETQVLQVHRALEVLGRAEPRLAQVAEMRYFGGYADTEIAQAFGVSTRTVRRDWDKARTLLLALLA